MPGPYPYYGPTGRLDNIASYRLDGTFALIGEDGDHFLDVIRKPQTMLVSGKLNVNNHAHVIASTTRCCAEWFFNYFRHRSLAPYLTRQGAGRYKLNKKALQDLRIVLPPLAEQRAINGVLRDWDIAIERAEQLASAKERHFSHEVSRLISRGRHSRGQLGTLVEEYNERNHGGSKSRVLSVTNSRGFLLPEDRFARRVASADLSHYKVVRYGQFAYNPSRINVGSIARLDDWGDGVLSPMYVVFGLDKSKVNSDYFLYWLSSSEAQERIKKSAQGSVRNTVSFADFSALTIPLPNGRRQAAIARYLNALQEEIALLGEAIAKLHKQQRGLMQKLLTGRWRLPVPSAGSGKEGK